MDQSRWNLGVVEELLEKRGERKAKSRIELLLGKANGVVPRLGGRHSIALQQTNGHSVWDAEAILELLLV